MSWTPKRCPRCDAEVYEALEYKGDQSRRRRVLFNTVGEWRTTLREKGDNLEEVQFQVYYRHTCLESDLRRKDRVAARTSGKFEELSKDKSTWINPIEFGEKFEFITGAYLYKCPRCGQDAGEQCRNLSYKRGIRLNHRAHKDRGYFALSERGYESRYHEDEGSWEIRYVGRENGRQVPAQS